MCPCTHVSRSVKVSAVFSFFFSTHAHTHTVINRHLVEHNPLAGCLKCDYQLGGEIKLLRFSVCFYLSVFPSSSLSPSLSLSSGIFVLQLLQLSMASTGDQPMSCHVDIRSLLSLLRDCGSILMIRDSCSQVSLRTIQQKSHSMAAPL